jgi:TAG lipase / lysophosphatidylethanolamine acyltransferase
MVVRTRQFRRGVLQTHEDVLKIRLQDASNYEEWHETARQLDIVLGNDRWRNNPVSPDYDYKLIAARLRHLRLARENDDIPTMVYRLRAGLLRNLGGLSELKLFRRSLLGY